MMKKQLQKFKLGVENLSRPNKPDKNSEELLAADTQVERYKDVLEKIVKKFGPPSGTSVAGVSLPGTGASSSSSGGLASGASGAGDLNGDGSGGGHLDAASREKRCKKLHEYRLALAMEESAATMPDGLLREVLSTCARLERNIAYEIVDNETKVEASVTRKLTDIMDRHLTTIQKQKRCVTKLMQDKESAKYKHQAAVRVSESAAKIAQLKEEQEECESKLEKERDIWAAEMFELIAEEENMANYIVNYVTAQRLYYKSALEQIEEVMQRVDGMIREGNKRIFKVPLEEHLSATDRKIAHVIEMCVCCLLERGLNEEGLLRVGCAGSKLRRFRTAIDASVAQTPLAAEYADVHVIAGVLKLYLRDLPEPLLTYRLYDEFVAATRRPTEEQCKRAILNALNQLPTANYQNLRYLTRFLVRLAANSGTNKMSSQNIAIVMSPNVLWSPAPEAGAGRLDSASDYMQKVNSSTAVNRIVELLVADWAFFFDGEVEFFVTLRRDELFREPTANGTGHAVGPAFAAGGAVSGGAATMLSSAAHHIEISDPMPSAMTKSMNAAYQSTTAAAAAAAAVGVHSTGTGASSSSSGGTGATHSRSNSHDTSLILLSGHLQADGAHKQLSQSSSSLSDASSPPGQNSPKLPVRRKHNKQAAPTPPDARQAPGADERFRHDAVNDDAPPAAKPTAAVRRVFEHSDSLASLHSHHQPAPAAAAARPDKPPRPAFTADCQTLNRSQYRSAKESTSSSHARPSALPKGMLFANRSTENLTAAADGGNTSPVQLRDRAGEVGGSGPMAAAAPQVAAKPAIPERPMSLMMRPNSFKAPAAAVSSVATAETQTGNSYSGGAELKKTHSFRGSSNGNGKSLNGGGGGPTTLERTHIYNVDKKQVAIIDFVDSNKSTTTTTAATATESKATGEAHPMNNGGAASIVTASLKITPASCTVTMPPPTAPVDTPAAQSSAGEAHGTTAPTTTHHFGVPPSPRGFDPKIKRPGIPAPPPPVAATAATGAAAVAGSRPKSENAGDSTHL